MEKRKFNVMDVLGEQLAGVADTMMEIPVDDIRDNPRNFYPTPDPQTLRARTPHIKRPDADNVAKAILDALNGHAYNDDSAIALLMVRKYQTTGASRVEVIIEEAE